MMPNRQGFTLGELLVVVGILAILIAILVPVATKGINAAQSTACLANLRSLGGGLALAIADNDGSVPANISGYISEDGETVWKNGIFTWHGAISEYVPTELPATYSGMELKKSPFRCPASPIQETFGSYSAIAMVSQNTFSGTLNAGAGDPRIKISRYHTPSKTPYLIDGPPSILQGRPARRGDRLMPTVQLGVQRPDGSWFEGNGGTWIRTRTGPGASGASDFWVPPHGGGQSLNILFLDGSVASFPTAMFTSPEFHQRIRLLIEQ